jgi:L-rhamnose mutarotase
MKRYCLTLDLKSDLRLIEEYEEYHKKIWPEIGKSIRDSGIEQMEIYRHGTRLVMVMDVNDHFSFDKKSEADKNNPKVKEWEELMWKYQQPVDGAAAGEKWVLMKRIFHLDD